MIIPEVLDILGHTITSQGLSAEPAKVLDVKSYTIPNNRKKLQGVDKGMRMPAPPAPTVCVRSGTQTDETVMGGVGAPGPPPGGAGVGDEGAGWGSARVVGLGRLGWAPGLLRGW